MSDSEEDRLLQHHFAYLHNEHLFSLSVSLLFCVFLIFLTSIAACFLFTYFFIFCCRSPTLRSTWIKSGICWMVCLCTEHMALKHTFMDTLQLFSSNKLEIQTLIATYRCMSMNSNLIIKGVISSGGGGALPHFLKS